MTFAEITLEKAIERRLVREVLLKDEKAFEALYSQLQTALTNSWDDAMREGVVNALDRLRDLGAGKFTKQDGEMILRVLERSIGPEALSAAMREPVINLTDAIFREGAEQVGKAAGVSIGFMRPDLDALDILKNGNLYWVGNSWNTTHQDRIAKILEDYFEKGMTRQQLAQRMAEDFAGVAERGRRYWELLADHTATKTREMGRVTGYDRAGIDYVQVRAWLDERTTEICRQMHGRVIPVTKMRAQRDAYLKAASTRDEAGMKEAWEMHGSSADFADTPTSKLGAGTASPPYHFKCRTITVIYVPSKDEPLKIKQKVIAREGVEQKDFDYARKRAQNSKFLNEKRARAKFIKHRANIPTRKLNDYEGDARALVADPSAQIGFSVRQPQNDRASGETKINAVFSKPHYNPHQKRDGYLVSIVSLEDNTIISHHWREKLESVNHLAYIEEKKKGAWKWLSIWQRKA